MSDTPREIRLVRPEPPLGDELILLSPLTAADADEIAAICDVEGFANLAHHVTMESEADPCVRLRPWGLSQMFSWLTDFDLRVDMVQACFAVRWRNGPAELLGIVGFNCPPGFTDKLNVYYWTSPAMRGQCVASRFVLAGMPWAFKAFGVSEAMIHAKTKASERVAEKAGFRRTDKALKGFPLFLWP